MPRMECRENQGIGFGKASEQPRLMRFRLDDPDFPYLWWRRLQICEKSDFPITIDSVTQYPSIQSGMDKPSVTEEVRRRLWVCSLLLRTGREE